MVASDRCGFKLTVHGGGSVSVRAHKASGRLEATGSGSKPSAILCGVRRHGIRGGVRGGCGALDGYSESGEELNCLIRGCGAPVVLVKVGLFFSQMSVGDVHSDSHAHTV